MKIKIRYSYADYYQALRLNAQYSKISWILSFIGLVFILLAVWSVLSYWKYTILDIITLAMGISLLFYKRLLLRFIAFVRFKQSIHLRKEYEFHIDEKKVQAEGPGEFSKSTWGSYYKTLYDKNVILLLKSPLLMTMIPRRVFKSEKDWQQLIELVQEKIPVVNR